MIYKRRLVSYYVINGPANEWTLTLCGSFSWPISDVLALY